MADDDRNNIPVFTVLKNNAILKNIFLLHAPPDMHGDAAIAEKEEILTVGRHPNCTIVLSHPSISRFHLQIRSKPSSGKLSVTDLSSVHGTWVSGKRIKPRDCVELNEGDELRLGGSRRVYKLHWVSVCQAYDLDNPFCPSSDVIMCDDIEKHEEESLFQDETGLLAKDDVSLNLEAKASSLSCEQVPLQRPDRNDIVLKGILKRKKESSPCIVKPLSLPLSDGETMKVAEVGEIDVEKQFKNAPFFSASEMAIECSQMVERDDLVPLDRNLSEDDEQMKQLCPLPESCIEDSTVKVEDCSQLLEVCIDSEGLLASQECLTAVSEKQFLLAEDQIKTTVDSTQGLFGINDEESSLKNTEKGINQSVIASQTPKLDLELGELCTTENGERSDAMLLDICEYTDAENEATNSSPVDAELTIYPESSDETWHSQVEIVSTEFVSDPRSINHESDEPEDKIQLSEIESRSLQLIVNSAAKLGPPREENVAIESGNGALVFDAGIKILEPLLDSFVFAEKDTKESCCFMSMQSVSESQSPETPFCAKSILDNGHEKVSKTVSNPRSDMSKVSSQRCQLLGALKILSCNSKRRERTTTARTQLRNSNADEKSVSKTQFEHEEDKYEITPDKENCSHNTRPWKSMTKMGTLDGVEFNSSKSYTSHSKNISSSHSQKETSMLLMGDLDNVEYEVEMYTPDKENFTPNTRLLKSMKRMDLFSENIMNSSVSDKSCSLKVFNSPLLVKQNYGSTAEKESESLYFGQEQAWRSVTDQTGNKMPLLSKQRKSERVPLQSLSVNSSCRSKPDASVNKVAARSRGSVTRAQFQRKTSPINNKIQLEAKVKWCMVVDSTCFVDSESRKALKLLRGLRGTKLIVPGTVLRELDAMKQQACFFRRTTEVSAALKWLEDCLVNTKWWIHIQSSFEEARHLLPTPPASPKLFDSTTHHSGKKSWKTFSIFRTLSEVSSPKTEDHILEYTLQQMRSIDGNQRIAILSNDTSLRIKAMAQGLICETATEFRDSLVNPFSERFLWSESSPRGRTWSCHDDIVLRQQFYSHHSNNSSQGHDNAKGLKLIMAYDSRDNKTASNLQWK